MAGWASRLRTTDISVSLSLSHARSTSDTRLCYSEIGSRAIAATIVVEEAQALVGGSSSRQGLDDGVGVLGSGGRAANVSCEGLALGDHRHGGTLDGVGVEHQSHVAQHQDGRQQQGGRVGLVLSCNIRCTTVSLRVRECAWCK